jgi:hypothetical protein
MRLILHEFIYSPRGALKDRVIVIIHDNAAAGDEFLQKNSKAARVGSYISTSMCTNLTGRGVNEAND